MVLGYVFAGPALAVVPQAGLGVWIALLTCWLSSGRRGIRSALLVTYGGLLLLGSLFVIAGFHAVASAERSTARGGGLLSLLALLPFLYGPPWVVLALCSIAIALAIIPGHRPGRTDGRS
jgi:hypothetical protein